MAKESIFRADGSIADDLLDPYLVEILEKAPGPFHAAIQLFGGGEIQPILIEHDDWRDALKNAVTLKAVKYGEVPAIFWPGGRLPVDILHPSLQHLAIGTPY